MLVAIAAGAIIGLMLGVLRTIEQKIKLLTIVLSIYELLWENYLAVLEVLILVCSSALPRGNLSTYRSDTPILGSGHVWLYPLDTVPTRPLLLTQNILPASSTAPYMLDPSPSTASHTPPPTYYQACGMYYNPRSPSSTYLS